MTRESMPRPLGRKLVVRQFVCSAAVVGTGALMLVGCSSASTSSAKPSAPTSPATSKSAAAAPASSQAPCKEINSLRGSLTSLTKTKISPSSSAQLTSDLKNVQKQLTTLKGKASGTFKTQLDGMETALNNVKKASGQLTTNPSGAVKSLTTNLTALKAQAGPVITELNTACPKGKS